MNSMWCTKLAVVVGLLCGAGMPLSSGAQSHGASGSNEPIASHAGTVVSSAMDTGGLDTSGKTAATATDKPGVEEHETEEASALSVLSPVAAGEDPAQSSSTDNAQGSIASAAPAKLNNGFFHLLGRAYVADWSGNSPGNPGTPPARRWTPAPVSSPPYPFADWPIGGTPTIGVPDTQTYPLMQAINENKSREKMYGWISIGANGSTNNRGHVSGVPANWPSAYDEYPNTVVLDQAAVYYERLPDTVQTNHFDYGFRLTALYGQDYRFTTAKGMLSQQLLVKNAQYGFDPVMFYTDLYFPHVAQGMNVRIGRYISLPDIEAQLAPNNYTYSHSILYTFDCYTQTGVNATVKLSNHWTVQAGLSPGCDVMPWTTDAKVTGNTCATYTWHNGGDALNTCANSINDGKYAYNNLAAYYETWYHKFNDHWHTDTEAWYQYMKATPNMYWYNGTDPATGIQYASTKEHPWPEATQYRPGTGAVNLNFGAVCQDPRLGASQQSARCYAQEWAVVNYIEHNFWKNTASLNIRNEIVNDIKGQRTGTPGYYEEHMVGFDFWAGSTVTFRPELSYTHAFAKYGARALDIAPGSAIANIQNGLPQTGKTQALTLAADLIWHF
jgi:hypothetical protein